MADHRNEVPVAVLQEKVKNLEESVEALKQDRDSAVRWALFTLGSALIGLGTWVFSLFEPLFKLK